MSRDIGFDPWQRATEFDKAAVQCQRHVEQPPTGHDGVPRAAPQSVPPSGDEGRPAAGAAPIAPLDILPADVVPAESAPSQEDAPAEPQLVPCWEGVDVGSTAPVIGNVLGGTEPRLGAAIPHRTPSCASDGLGVGQFYVAAASHVGLSHVVHGTPRQDAYNFALTTSGRLVVAVADGMGSRPQSQVGATHFCDSVAFAASDRPYDSAAEYLLAAAVRAGDVAAVSYHLERDAVSFVGAVAVIDGDRCEVARVGDVSAFSINAEGELTELFTTGEGHVNVVGRSLPAENPLEPELIIVREMRRIVLATDGLANDLRTSPAARSWLGRVWARLPTAHAMSDALRYERRGSHDDRTVVVVAVPGPNPTAVTTSPADAGGPAP